MVDYFQLSKSVTRGNANDQQHACHMLDVDFFFTADKGFFSILEITFVLFFQNTAKVIFIDRNHKLFLPQL
jgi:hypothetical protein